ncbi:MAG: hypothetical protein WDW21_05670 [Neisseriaceae bacterium]
MGRTKLKTLISVVVAGLLVGACACNQGTPTQAQPTEKIVPISHYQGFEYRGNYVWGGAMNLAWTELSDSILKAPLAVESKDLAVQRQVAAYNHPVFTRSDIQPEAYYIKSGYGPQTVQLINREVKEKFPQKTFSDLNLLLGDRDFLAYAYLFKTVKYKSPFAKDQLSFAGQPVDAFSAKNMTMRKNVSLLDYRNDDQFIVRLALQNEGEELYLVKGYSLTSADQLVALLGSKKDNPLVPLNSRDEFKAPKLVVDAESQHKDLNNLVLLNQGFRGYRLGALIEKIKFNMDEVGARVENEAYIGVRSMAALPPPPKKLILDQPYWVVLKEKQAQSPYFILEVRNTEFMKKHH